MIEIFKNRDIQLEYEDTGSGIPFLFLHGMGGGIHQINGTYIPRTGIRLINMNQQGHGNSGSDWNHYNFNYLADDAIALLDHLHIEKAVIGGISMGAAVSLNLALRYPDRVLGLLLIRNAWTDRPMDADRILAYRDMGNCLYEGGWDAFVQTGGWDIVKEPSGYTRNAFTLPFNEAFNVQNWKKFLLLPLEQPIPAEASLSDIHVPVSVIACRDDFCHPYGYGIWVHERIPHSTFTEIPSKDANGGKHKTMINDAIDTLFAQLQEA